jgi:hypothetical protein
MKAITLRNIPVPVQKAIEHKARQKKVSVNRAVIELLEERIGVLEKTNKTVHHDLDDLAGSWSKHEARAFERAIRIGRKIDKELWR